LAKIEKFEKGTAEKAQREAEKKEREEREEAEKEAADEEAKEKEREGTHTSHTQKESRTQKSNSTLMLEVASSGRYNAPRLMDVADFLCKV
jgi:hypothetical protein